MFLSIFEIFKVGVGPSSSHTMGPMTAAGLFLEKLKAENINATSLGGSLHGSLAFTGIGHRTDRAVILGLDGFTPDDFDPDAAKMAEDRIATHKTVKPAGQQVTVGTFDDARAVVVPIFQGKDQLGGKRGFFGLCEGGAGAHDHKQKGNDCRVSHRRGLS